MLTRMTDLIRCGDVTRVKVQRVVHELFADQVMDELLLVLSRGSTRWNVQGATPRWLRPSNGWLSRIGWIQMELVDHKDRFM